MKSNEDEDEKLSLVPPRVPRKSSRYGLDVIEESDVVEEGTFFFSTERSKRRFRYLFFMTNRSVSTR